MSDTYESIQKDADALLEEMQADATAFQRESEELSAEIDAKLAAADAAFEEFAKVLEEGKDQLDSEVEESNPSATQDESL